MIVFAHHQKTAGTTFIFVLRANFGWQHCQSAKVKTKLFTQKDLEKVRRGFPGLKSLMGHNLMAPTEHLTGDDLFFATMLREPVKRMASHFQDHSLRGGNTLDFKNWCARYPETHNVQTVRTAGVPDVEKAKAILAKKYHYIGLTEDFNQSLKLFKVLSPYPVSINYNKRNAAATKKHSRSVLENPENLKLAQETNALDLELYRFAKEELYPQLLAKHQKALEETPDPTVFPADYKPFKFRLSKFYNNVIFSSLEKLKRT